MRYPKIRYLARETAHELILHHFDGTFRVVRFESSDAAHSARRPGRAELDCIAIEYGLLPHGATKVSPPSARPLNELIAEAGIADVESYTTEGRKRISAGLSRLADRQGGIGPDDDRRARNRQPEEAGRYARSIAGLNDLDW